MFSKFLQKIRAQYDSLNSLDFLDDMVLFSEGDLPGLPVFNQEVLEEVWRDYRPGLIPAFIRARMLRLEEKKKIQKVTEWTVMAVYFDHLGHEDMASYCLREAQAEAGLITYH